MSIFETFAKRMKRSRGELPDVYKYDSAPEPLRVQLVQIMMELLGGPSDYHDSYGTGRNVQESYRHIVEVLRRERGVFKLPPTTRQNTEYIEELANHLLAEQDIEELLSAIEIICRYIENVASKYDYRYLNDAEETSKKAIEEINHRFREHGIGYEYNGELIRIDSELIHKEAVKPALRVLTGKIYKGAQQEFLSGYEHYRKRKYKEALNDALKALESTLKAILDKRGWQYDANRDTCSKLIQVALVNGLIPQFWEAHFTGLRATLEAGVPTVRNRMGGHGQGSVPQAIPPHLVAYALHMTAAAILFLVKSEEALP